MSRLRVADLRRRTIESRPRVRETRYPKAAAAPEQRDWLRWLELGGASQKTLEGYSWTTDRLLREFPNLPFGDVTDSELLHVLTTFPVKSRPGSKARFASWFKWGVRTRRITVNPIEFLPDFKKALQPIVEIFTVEEEAALRSLSEPHGTLMALLFDTGIRKAEARHLTGKRVDFRQERLIVIEGAKGGKQRTIPIDQDSAPFLLGRLDGMLVTEGIGLNDWLWPIRPGGGSRVKHDRPIHPASWHWWWTDQIAAAGVRYLKPHTTRHTYASRWRSRGLDLADIQLLLGHESIVTTQRIYVHQGIEEVARRMAAVRAGAKES
jgi:integrase